MANRLLLRNQLIEAWSECIATDYVRQRINSERSLQASLWSKLNEKLDPKNRRMFIEPGISYQSARKRANNPKRRIPDLVVCNSRFVIGVIELKYQPKVQPNWKKDLETLVWIAKQRRHFAIKNTRFRGVEADNRTYSFPNDILSVWAGIHAPAGISLRENVPPSLRDCFLELHAETAQDGNPHLWAQSGRYPKNL